MLKRLVFLALLLNLNGLWAQEEKPPLNRLAQEKSPYLQQHARNPVDWWPWGDAAFAEAKRRGLPVFLSIGYSTCHWCHVMEKESFEDPEVAAVLNEAFVCIKLDREERPDIDAVYMKVIQALNGRGGWPATLLLTPDRKAFWAATYLPPNSLRAVTEQVSKLWQEDRASIDDSAQKILDHLVKTQSREASKNLPRQNLLDAAASEMALRFDEEHGGFGDAPKFPQMSGLLFLLRSEDERAPNMAWQTLKAIAHGGIHDHLAGGLHRYSVDAAWRVPHFEKMLYDQAQALETYAELGSSCNEQRAYGMAEDIATCLLRDFRGPGGGFYSAYDADSEDKEGAYYVWTLKELQAALSEDELKVVLHRFDIHEKGNWEEAEGLPQANVLILKHVFAETAAALKMPEAEAIALWRRARTKLLEVRGARIAPRLDAKVITAWNGLAISALARAGRTMNRPDWIAAAMAAADFIETKLRDEDGLLLRRYIDGEAAHPATLVDHAYLAMALIDLFEVSAEAKWLERALVEAEAIARYHDPKAGGFWDSLEDQDLFYRTSDGYDGAMPSANGIATLALLRLHTITTKANYLALAESALKSFRQEMEQYPLGFPVLLRALRMRLEGSRELIVVGDSQDEAFQELVKELRSYHRKDMLVLTLSPVQAEKLAELVPVVAGKVAGKEAAARAYLCHNQTCELPVGSWAELKLALEATLEDEN